MMYYGTFHYGMDGGFMITASHNPSDYNGIKIVREEGIPVSADTGLKDIETLAFSGNFPECVKKGNLFHKEILSDYIASLLSFVDVKAMKPFHIVVNAGNGCANIAFSELKSIFPSILQKCIWILTAPSPMVYLIPCWRNAGNPLWMRYFPKRRTWVLPGTVILTGASLSMKRALCRGLLHGRPFGRIFSQTS